jgi:N5-(carboxyethyl)ornithine synthase
MQSIGFVISGKENERRRALLPADLRRVHRREFLVFEENYATHLGFPDSSYTELGCRIVPCQVI